MSNTSYSDWQDKAGYPAPGIGDLDDLKTTIKSGFDGQWISYINPGYYYDGEFEQYSYISKSTVTTVLPNVSGVITHPVSFRPAWGPVLVSDSNDLRYTEHHNCYLPANVVTWSRIGSTNLYTTLVPTGTIVLGVRDYTNISLFSQPSTGYVADEKSYHYNNDSGLVTVFSKENPPNRFVDIGLFQPRLKIREHVVDNGDGTCTSSYKNIDSVTITRGDTTQSAANSTTGIIPHSFNTYKGDWLILEYYISNSFCLVDHKTIHVYNSSPPSTLAVASESSVPGFPNMIIQTTPVSGQALQLNPMFSDSFRAGYLYHSASGTVTLPAKLDINADKQFVISTFKEYVKITARAYDKDGLPIPQSPVTLTHNLTPSNTVVLLPAALSSNSTSFTTKTDNRGEVHWFISVSANAVSGYFNYSISGLNGSYASGRVLTIPKTTAISSEKYISGFVALSQSRLKTTKGYSKIYANTHYIDGIPCPAASGITLKFKKASLAQFKDNATGQESNSLGGGVISVPNDLENIGFVCGLNEELGFSINGSDVVFATSRGGQSPIVTVLEEL